MANSVAAKSSGKPRGDGLAKRMSRFIRESWIEVVKKASWPNRTELRKLTLVVIVAVLVVGAYIGVLDGILSQISAPLLGGTVPTK